MNKELINSDYETLCEDIKILYKHFRQKGIEPGAASGRTLYELEEDLRERSELVVIAYLVLCGLIVNDAKGSRELIEYYFRRITSEVVNPTVFLMSIYGHLNESNKADFAKMLNGIYRYIARSEFNIHAQGSWHSAPRRKIYSAKNVLSVTHRMDATRAVAESLVTMYST